MGFIANNTVLTNFAGVGRLDVLRQIFGTLQIAEEVRLEVHDGLEAGYLHQEGTLAATRGEGAWIQVAAMSDKEREDFDDYSRLLGYGESASVAIAHHRDLTFLSDDKRARRFAKEIGVEVVGSVGLLKLAADRKILSLEEADQLLGQMTRSGYFSPIASMSELDQTEEPA